jgi:hypothetical protein
MGFVSEGGRHDIRPISLPSKYTLAGAKVDLHRVFLDMTSAPTPLISVRSNVVQPSRARAKGKVVVAMV